MGWARARGAHTPLQAADNPCQHNESPVSQVRGPPSPLTRGSTELSAFGAPLSRKNLGGQRRYPEAHLGIPIPLSQKLCGSSGQIPSNHRKDFLRK